MTQYIITDPCYLINQDKWSQLYDLASANDIWDDEKFIRSVKDELEIITQADAWVSNTGFGDWENTLHGIPETIITENGDFYADSGMVCVCKVVDDITTECLKHVNDINDCAAIFEVEGELTVDIDTRDPQWTYIEMNDSDGNAWNTVLPPDEDEYEEDELNFDDED